MGRVALRGGSDAREPLPESGAQLSADRGKPASRVNVSGFPGAGTPYAIVAVDEVRIELESAPSDAEEIETSLNLSY